MTGPWRPSAEVLAQEEAHRRALVAGVASLILLSMSAVFGHHLAPGAQALLAGRDHLWRLCLIAAHELAAPVHLLFHVLVFGGLLFAAYDRVRAWLSVRHALSRVIAVTPEPHDPFWRAAMLAGLHPARVWVVDGLPTPAFTSGLLRPRVYIARSILNMLSFEEIVAVLTHEASHVFRRDPLRLSLLRALSCTLFWLPAVRRLAADAADEAEIRADDYAARRDPLVLGSAILALARWRESEGLHEGVAFQQLDLFDRRVRRLAGELVPPRSHLTRGSALAAVAVLLMAWTTGALVTHPLPEHLHAADIHCEHRSGRAFDHLFCLGLALAERSPDCPHASAA